METFRERTLATRYQPRQQLPPNFPDILKEYAREVLRSQPDDILSWSADYFRQLALETDPLQPQQPPPGHFTAEVEDEGREVLVQSLVKALVAVDEQQRGLLPPSLVSGVLQENFGLSPTQALYVLTAPSTDVDEAGTIAYEPLAKEAVRAVQFFQESGQDFGVASEEEDENTTVHGLNRKDVEGDFFKMFRLLDEPQMGLLPYADYSNALINAPYHLTIRDIRALCFECERVAYPTINDDGEVAEAEVQEEGEWVNYEHERARWFDLLRLTEQFELFDIDSSEDGEEEGDA